MRPEGVPESELYGELDIHIGYPALHCEPSGPSLQIPFH